MSEGIRQCTLGGYLYGIICPRLNVYDLIAGAEIYAVRSTQQEPTPNPTGLERGDAKRVIRTVSKDELKRVTAGKGVMEGRTDDRGFFCLNDRSYEGGLLDLYVCINAVPGPKKESLPLEEPTCLFIGTYEPRRTLGGWYVSLYIPQSIWCALKKLVDVWTVAGRVATCEGNNALGNVTVIARDVDVVQHDLLGEGVTNSLGIFRIDYLGNAFRHGTIIDVELFGGPDIYFEIKDSNGNSLLAEDPSRGRHPGRCDSGPCKCVDLCVEIPGTNEGDIPSAWIRVGTAFLIPDSTVALNDFDAQGYAGGASKYVLTSAPAMRGGVPRQTLDGHAIEYRFRVGNTTAANNVASLPEAAFTRIVGAGPIADKNLFVTTPLGDLMRIVSFSPYVTETVTIAAFVTDLTVDGWLNVNQVIQNRFVELGRDPGTIPLFGWIPTGNLMLVNTGALPTAANVPDGAAAAGGAVPVANHIPIEKMSLRFETRTSLGPLPGNGKTLNSMIVNNNPVFLKLAIKEQVDSADFCGIIHVNPPHISYTVYHPHMGSANINVHSNNFTYNHDLNDPEPPIPPLRLPLSGNTTPTPLSINRIDLNLPGVLHKCNYLVTLTGASRRHTGDSAIGTETPVQTMFYFDPAP